MKCDLDNCNLVDDLVRDDLSSSKLAKNFIRAFSADPIEAVLDACESLSCPCVYRLRPSRIHERVASYGIVPYEEAEDAK
jgi:hypothetical protein